MELAALTVAFLTVDGIGVGVSGQEVGLHSVANAFSRASISSIDALIASL